MRARLAVVLASAMLVVVLVAGPAAATWSIVAVDPESGDVGVAIASCVPGSALGDLERPLAPVVLVPGVGAAVTQAALNDAAADELRRVLDAGASADEAIAAVVDPSFDADAADRQHAVATLSGTAGGFTGDRNLAVALDRQGDGVSAQGNILVSNAVIDDALDAFAGAAGDDLAARLVAALQAGADAGGDSRCDDQTALFAQVAVAAPGDDPTTPSVLLTVVAGIGSNQNPVDELSAEFAAGRRVGVSESGLSFGQAALIGGAGLAVLIGLVFALRRRRARGS